MTYVALALALALVLLVVGFANLLRAQQRANSRERDLILNQLLNAVGKPWQQAPADEPPTPAPIVPIIRRYVESPEQIPLEQ